MTTRHILGALLLVSSAAAIHTTPLPSQHQVEISPHASSRIVRHELNEAASLAEVGGKFKPLELNPNIMGGANGAASASTTEIVQSGEGPTTTAIYAVGSGPKGGEAPNAIDLTPAPWAIKPGSPGPPGISGPPGPPGEPGPPEGQTLAPSTTPAVKNTTAPLLGASATKPLDANTQSGYEIRGPPGATGGKGHAGKKGALGSQGLEGNLGQRGPIGVEGEAGERGPPGARKFPHAPKLSMMWVALGINLFIAFVVFIMSYLEFVSEKKPIPYLFGGECCSSKCGRSGERFNGCFYRLSCGICCRPFKHQKAAGEYEGEGEGYGEEQYGGYEQQ